MANASAIPLSLAGLSASDSSSSAGILGIAIAGEPSANLCADVRPKGRLQDLGIDSLIVSGEEHQPWGKMDEIYLTPLSTAKETARVLAVSERTLWSLTKNGEIPCVRIRASVRYTPEAIARFIEANTTPRTK